MSGSTILGLILSGCQLKESEQSIPTPIPISEPTIQSVPTATLSACMARAYFGDPKDSEYILPYPVGKQYRVLQTYCEANGSHSDQLAYDFEMPVGADVIAARSGGVRLFRDNKPDKSVMENIGEYNYIYIEHEDGTVAFYAHLKQDSIVVVRYGEYVEVGQLIAKSGNSGFTAGKPQLHFGVYQFYPAQDGYDVAVEFSECGWCTGRKWRFDEREIL